MRSLTGLDFAAAVAGLIGRPLGDDERFAVAVSGGPDSLALLLLAHAAFGDRVRALTVDHRLRAESAAEAAKVATLAQTFGVPHATLLWDGDKPSANIQAAARDARYGLMSAWCAANGIAWIATAHHADDQAETLLMRLSRGAGLSGLTGVRPRRPLADGVTLLRPLLGTRRATLAKIVGKAGITAVDDPANSDPRYDRSHARALFARVPWLDAERFAASASHLADAEAALGWTAVQAWRGRALQAGDVLTVDAAGLPRELRRRLALRAVQALDPDAAPDGPEIDRFLAALDAGNTATLGAVKAEGGPPWTFHPAPSRRTARPEG